MTARKQQHQEWDKQLSLYLSQILLCERCRLRPAKDKAHRLKRRFIGWRTDLDRLEYFMAAKLCRACHKSFDEATGEDVHERMFVAITKIVLNRHKKRLVGAYVEPHSQRTWDPLWVNQIRRD